MYECIHTHVHTYIQMHTYACTHTHTRMHVLTHAHTQLSHTYACSHATHTCMHTHIYIYASKWCTHPHMLMHAHALKHTLIHAHTHMHRHTLSSFSYWPCVWVYSLFQIKLWYDVQSYQLIVTIISAIELPLTDSGKFRNPYCKLYLLPDRRWGLLQHDMSWVFFWWGCIYLLFLLLGLVIGQRQALPPWCIVELACEGEWKYSDLTWYTSVCLLHAVNLKWNSTKMAVVCAEFPLWATFPVFNLGVGAVSQRSLLLYKVIII